MSRGAPSRRSTVDTVRVVVAQETAEGERRVAVVPETVATLVGAGCQVLVQAGAGLHAFVSDDELGARGATIATDRMQLLQGADAVLAVQPLPVGDISLL